SAHVRRTRKLSLGGPQCVLHRGLSVVLLLIEVRRLLGVASPSGLALLNAGRSPWRKGRLGGRGPGRSTRRRGLRRGRVGFPRRGCALGLPLSQCYRPRSSSCTRDTALARSLSSCPPTAHPPSP